MNPLSPNHMTPRERRAELCRILALGLRRLKLRQSSEVLKAPGESSLHIAADECGHATTQKRSAA